MPTQQEIEAQKKKIADELAMLFKNQMEAKQAAENIRLAEKSAHYSERDAELKQQKNELLSEAKKLYESGQYGYDTWSAAMSCLLANDLLVVKYLSAILPDEQSKMMDRFNGAGNKLANSKVGQFMGFGDFKPGVDFDVEFDSHGKMTVQNLRRHDKQEMTHDVKDAIKRAAGTLLIHHGCTERDGVFYDQNGGVMTQDKYKAHQQGYKLSESVSQLIQQGLSEPEPRREGPRP